MVLCRFSTGTPWCRCTASTGGIVMLRAEAQTLNQSLGFSIFLGSVIMFEGSIDTEIHTYVIIYTHTNMNVNINLPINVNSSVNITLNVNINK